MKPSARPSTGEHVKRLSSNPRSFLIHGDVSAGGATTRSREGRATGFVSFCLVCLMIMITSAFAETRYQGPPQYRDGHYGQFCPGSRRGGPYGARDPVGTADEARRIINKCFATTNQSLKVGRMDDREWYFVAEIRDLNGETVDVVIMDKRSGRIRSTR
jgi:hypothetical protein